MNKDKCSAAEEKKTEEERKRRRERKINVCYIPFKKHEDKADCVCSQSEQISSPHFSSQLYFGPQFNLLLTGRGRGDKKKNFK